MSALLFIDGEQIPVIPDARHEYVLSTAEVAKGYGVSESVIRKHKTNHVGELVDGKHFFTGTNIPSGRTNQAPTMWTKKGVVRLGFFIKSERAAKFRDAAEDLICNAVAPVASPALKRAQEAIERMQAEAASAALALVKPAATYGTPSPSTGEPRTRLMRSYWTSRWAQNEISRRLVDLDQQQLELGEILEDLREESGRAIA